VLPAVSPLRKADAIVVLGNRPPADERGNVRPETQRRVEAGVGAFMQQMAPLIVMSGGKTGRWVEAEVMRDLAVKLGVPEAAIVLESRSTSTITNARHAIEVLRRRLDRKDVSVIVVSSPYHLARAGRLFECTGAAVQLLGAEVPDSYLYKLGFTLYEIFQRAMFMFVDECAQARGEESRDSYRGMF
jgi:uncharacterized SAM-binding protein YcdF (DUF218 family)